MGDFSDSDSEWWEDRDGWSDRYVWWEDRDGWSDRYEWWEDRDGWSDRYVQCLFQIGKLRFILGLSTFDHI